jgi:bacterioferritin-associated ferredoxin
MIVCICQNVSDRQIREAVYAGATSMPEVRNQLGVGTCCGKCHPHAKQVLRECIESAGTMRDQPQPSVFRRGSIAA